jgi:hypothetical protein
MPAEPDGPAVPDPPAEPVVGVVVTQVGAAEPVAAACALAGLEVDAVLSGVGVLVVCRDTSEGGPERVAETLTRSLAGVPAVLLVRREGRIRAHQWSDGVQGDEMIASLALDGAPEALGNLLLGTERIADFPDAVTSVGLGRVRALRMLAGSARSARRSARRAKKAS